MRFICQHPLAAAATLAVFALAAPVSGASAQVFPFETPNVNTIGGQAAGPGCDSNAPAGVGYTGGTIAQNCFSVLAFTGPAVGEVATNIGPTIIGATVLAPITVSAGPVQN